jgi:hypothetical protein
MYFSVSRVLRHRPIRYILCGDVRMMEFAWERGRSGLRGIRQYSLKLVICPSVSLAMISFRLIFILVCPNSNMSGRALQRRLLYACLGSVPMLSMCACSRRCGRHMYKRRPLSLNWSRGRNLSHELQYLVPVMCSLLIPSMMTGSFLNPLRGGMLLRLNVASVLYTLTLIYTRPAGTRRRNWARTAAHHHATGTGCACCTTPRP